VENDREKVAKEGQFFPGNQENDFGALLYHLIASSKPALVESYRPSGTTIMHMQMGYGWVEALRGHKRYKRAKLDLAFIDPRQVITWDGDRDACRNLKIIGAIELKRNVRQSWRSFEDDLVALEDLGNATKGQYFGILAATYAFPWSKAMKAERRRVEQICNHIDDVKTKRDVSFVSFHYPSLQPLKYPCDVNEKRSGFKDAKEILKRWS
jgi:hypothetical protein